MEHREGTLTGSLELASAFSSQINTGVPVELVEAENQGPTELPGENGAQNVSGEDAMEISVEGDTATATSSHGLDSTKLSAATGTSTVEFPVVQSASEVAAAVGGGGISVPAAMSTTEVTPSGSGSLGGSSGGQLSVSQVQDNPVSSTTHQNILSSSTFPPQQSTHHHSLSGGPSASHVHSQSMLSSTDNLHSTQLAHTVMEQLSDAPGLEITSDAITSMSLPNVSLGGAGGSGGGYGMPQISSYSSTPSVSLMASRGHRDLLTGTVSYGDLDLSVGANTSAIDTSNVLDPDSPSSVESNFDSSELLSNPLSQQDEVTQRLTQAGPVGIAAAAAIMSGSRKRKRGHTFETNPSFRKRHCSKLSKRLKETIDELSVRVGLQAVVVTYRPGKGNGKNDPSFKVFGAAPLVNIVRNQRDVIVNEMESALHQQVPAPATPPATQQTDPLFELPPLVFDGIPTPVHKMTQAQLRTFIPSMLKFSTGRGKPGWGKEDVRPPWWPEDVPWANVRSDIRTAEQKRALQWTDALRRIVINCYLHHGRMDLLPEFSLDLLQQYLTPQVAEQIQAQLDSLQQQQEQEASNASITEVPMPTVNADSAAADEVAAALNEITEASGGVEGRDDPEMMVGGDNQQVFTVDTGIGNCDMAGMPTLADASLAETAARLQQLADETGEVQYATQTVTVTDRDAKALGQPVGSTTTVLLTAYPGGHSGGAAPTSTSGGPAGSGGVAGAALPGSMEQPSSVGGGGGSGGGGGDVGGPADPAAVAATQQFLTTQPNSTGNVQVVYSASHIDPIPGTMSSDVTNTSLTNYTTPGSLQVGGVEPGVGGGQPQDGSTSMGVSDYLNPAPSQVMMSQGEGNTEGVVGSSDAASDLAAELIREYSLGGEGLERKPAELTPLSGGASEVKSSETSES